MNITVELEYLARDTEFLFRLGDALGVEKGVEFLGASGGLIFNERNKAVGREGVIELEAADTATVDAALSFCLAAVKEGCGVTRLNLVVRKSDDSIDTEFYLPKRLRPKS